MKELIMSFLDKTVDIKKWGRPCVCGICGWVLTTEDKWTLRDCLFPPHMCRNCKSTISLGPIKVCCPSCGLEFGGGFRWPKTLRMALWGGNYCAKCHIEVNKWGTIEEKENKKT